MGCCGGKQVSPDGQPDDGTKPLEKGGQGDISEGPCKNRGCTDILCLLLFVASWVLFVVVVFAAAGDGNPQKLYKPRDYAGNYCGLKEDGGIDLESHEKKIWLMNVTGTVEIIAKELICSNQANAVLSSRLSTDEYREYQCACCIIPCESCTESLDFTDFSSTAGLSTAIASKMADLTNPSAGVELFSPDGANGGDFNDVFNEMNTYFVEACVNDCDATTRTPDRTYDFMPPGDVKWYTAWRVLSTDTTVPAWLSSTMSTSFRFNALPLDACPYDPQYCIPFPGVEFGEAPNDYCAFRVMSDVVNSVGDALDTVGAADAVNAAEEGLGAAAGDLLESMDSTVIVGIYSFIVGLVFLLVLRFVVGIVVWASVWMVLIALIAVGALAWVRSSQCAGDSITDTGSYVGTAVVTTASSGVEGLVTGNTLSESFTGDGEDYRGGQTYTRTGRRCQAWSSNTPHTTLYNPTLYPDADLESNYCRNPGGDARTIWCYTTDADQYWESCQPLGVLRGECINGYEVESEDMRKALEICAYIIWAIAGIWVIFICCMYKRIKLAIAINKVAAQFVYNTPSVLFVPVIQGLIAVIWIILWAFCASFLLSQVPTDYVESGSYESYAIAHGTADDPGKCTDQWPTGFTYKYMGDFAATNDPCTGNMGDITGIVPACWKCAPPRYIIDTRVFYALFHFLWVNAFIIACGQCIIAGACGVWFFAHTEEKTSVKSVRLGCWNTFRYHTGSLAFGAFILAVVQMIRIILKYLEKNAAAQKNRVMVIIFKVLQCCMACVERCVKFLNKNAYIQVALVGTNFCVSAKNAFMLILRNFVRFGTVAILGNITRLLGLVFIVSATAVLGYFILQALHPELSPGVPVFVYVVIGYVIAKLYMNVFGLAVDTMLQCYIATEELGGDNGFVPGPLKGFLGHQKKKDDK
mmetsp:Transcript_59842/g.142551  ORF Transcript_59842/g.142551 Transcript_59842/m.142551 type:complete len:923 (-) Transcript_59842:163-2931(-)